eukprot:364319-Chlamydomonas_euryale.AAC.15
MSIMVRTPGLQPACKELFLCVCSEVCGVLHEWRYMRIRSEKVWQGKGPFAGLLPEHSPGGRAFLPVRLRQVRMDRHICSMGMPVEML